MIAGLSEREKWIIIKKTQEKPREPNQRNPNAKDQKLKCLVKKKRKISGSVGYRLVLERWWFGI